MIVDIFWSDLHTKILIELDDLQIQNLVIEIFGFNSHLSQDEIKYCQLGYSTKSRYYTSIFGNYLVVCGEDLKTCESEIMKRLAIISLDFYEKLQNFYKEKA